MARPRGMCKRCCIHWTLGSMTAARKTARTRRRILSRRWKISQAPAAIARMANVIRTTLRSERWTTNSACSSGSGSGVRVRDSGAVLCAAWRSRCAFSPMMRIDVNAPRWFFFDLSGGGMGEGGSECDSRDDKLEDGDAERGHDKSKDSKLQPRLAGVVAAPHEFAYRDLVAGDHDHDYADPSGEAEDDAEHVREEPRDALRGEPPGRKCANRIVRDERRNRAGDAGGEEEGEQAEHGHHSTAMSRQHNVTIPAWVSPGNQRSVPSLLSRPWLA